MEVHLASVAVPLSQHQTAGDHLTERDPVRKSALNRVEFLNLQLGFTSSIMFDCLSGVMSLDGLVVECSLFNL